MYAFLHFTMNTFTDKEWGYGDEDPRLFHPTAFDADAIIDALARGGDERASFSLASTTMDSVFGRPAPPVIRWLPAAGAMAKATLSARSRARRQKRGLKFGVYLSPWDRHQAAYGKPEYISIYRAQLKELLTEYGPIFEESGSMEQTAATVIMAGRARESVLHRQTIPITIGRTPGILDPLVAA